LEESDCSGSQGWKPEHLLRRCGEQSRISTGGHETAERLLVFTADQTLDGQSVTRRYAVKRGRKAHRRGGDRGDASGRVSLKDNLSSTKVFQLKRVASNRREDTRRPPERGAAVSSPSRTATVKTPLGSKAGGA